ncbi:hypothetical protein G9A89_022296 [Geosiphon pyriformis]|nr:hypothetical protein G9A89_022296 [Geosiphon pyriformis]
MSRSLKTFDSDRKRPPQQPPNCFCDKIASPAYSEEFGLLYECHYLHDNPWLSQSSENIAEKGENSNNCTRKTNDSENGSSSSVKPNNKESKHAICGFHIHKDTWDSFFNMRHKDPHHSELDVCPYFNFTFCAYFQLQNNFPKYHPPPPKCFCGLLVKMRTTMGAIPGRLQFTCPNYQINGARPKCTWHLWAQEVPFERPAGCIHPLKNMNEKLLLEPKPDGSDDESLSEKKTSDSEMCDSDRADHFPIKNNYVSGSRSSSISTNHETEPKSSTFNPIENNSKYNTQDCGQEGEYSFPYDGDIQRKHYNNRRISIDNTRDRDNGRYRFNGDDHSKNSERYHSYSSKTLSHSDKTISRMAGRGDSSSYYYAQNQHLDQNATSYNQNGVKSRNVPFSSRGPNAFRSRDHSRSYNDTRKEFGLINENDRYPYQKKSWTKENFRNDATPDFKVPYGYCKTELWDGTSVVTKKTPTEMNSEKWTKLKWEQLISNPETKMDMNNKQSSFSELIEDERSFNLDSQANQNSSLFNTVENDRSFSREYNQKNPSTSKTTRSNRDIVESGKLIDFKENRPNTTPNGNEREQFQSSLKTNKRFFLPSDSSLGDGYEKDIIEDSLFLDDLSNSSSTSCKKTIPKDGKSRPRIIVRIPPVEGSCVSIFNTFSQTRPTSISRIPQSITVDKIEQFTAENEKLLHKNKELESENKILQKKFDNLIRHEEQTCRENKDLKRYNSRIMSERESEQKLRQSCQKKNIELETSILDLNRKVDVLNVQLGKEREEKLITNVKCRVCFEETITHAISPCFHLVMCEKCVQVVDKCCVCREPKEGIVLRQIMDEVKESKINSFLYL